MKEFYFKDTIYYRVNEFRSDRLTLVFVHGLSGSSSAWLPYEKIFENKYNILAFDIRGHGKSKKFPNYSDYEIKNFAEDIHDLTSHLNINKFILISHSFATLVALEYIKLWRETVVASIFLSPILGIHQGFGAKILRVILKLSGILNWFPFKAVPGGHVDYTKHPNTSDWNLKRCYADVRNTTLRVYFYCLRQSLVPLQEYFLERINIPTLIIHGTKDTMVKAENAVAMSKKIKNSELVLIPDTDHIVVLNNIKEILSAIESFISKNAQILVSHQQDHSSSK